MIVEPRLLTPVQAAERLQISRTKLFALLKAGELESVCIGRLRRIPSEEIEAFVAGLVHQGERRADSQ